MKELSQPFIEHQRMHKQIPKIKWINASQPSTTNQNHVMQIFLLGLNTRQRDTEFIPLLCYFDIDIFLHT